MRQIWQEYGIYFYKLICKREKTQTTRYHAWWTAHWYLIRHLFYDLNAQQMYWSPMTSNTGTTGGMKYIPSSKNSISGLSLFYPLGITRNLPVRPRALINAQGKDIYRRILALYCSQDIAIRHTLFGVQSKNDTHGSRFVVFCFGKIIVNFSIPNIFNFVWSLVIWTETVDKIIDGQK